MRLIRLCGFVALLFAVVVHHGCGADSPTLPPSDDTQSDTSDITPDTSDITPDIGPGTPETVLPDAGPDVPDVVDTTDITDTTDTEIACGDDDNDGVCNADDRCPSFDDNLDDDDDGIADGCDRCPSFDDNLDDDDDGIADGCDRCPSFDDNLDDDDDGTADGCDRCPGHDDALDDDIDGTADGCDRCAGADDDLDDDGDETPNACDCDADNCHADATCRSGATSTDRIVCACKTGFTGDGVTCADIDECAVNLAGCDPVAGCQNTPGAFTCGDCPEGYTGGGAAGCVDINECLVNEGGCDPLTRCANVDGSFTCSSCPAGYSGTGLTGCVDRDECQVGNGGCSQRCVNDIGAYTCLCQPGFTLGGNGRSCDDINECATNNGGCAQQCANSPGGFACNCAAGYALQADKKTCADVDECAYNNGGCAQTCVNATGTFACDCQSGFVVASDGRSCDDIDECATNNGDCQGTCANGVGFYACGCPAGYSLAPNGRACTDINECRTRNGGCDPLTACMNIPGTRTCSDCPTGYSGSGLTACVDVNECSSANGGCDALTACTNLPGSRICGACPNNYSGSGLTGCVDMCLLGAPPSLSLITDSGLPTDGITNVPNVFVAFASCGSWEYQVDGGPLVAGLGDSFQLRLGTHSYAVQRRNAQGGIISGGAPVVFAYDAESTAILLVLKDANGQPIAFDPQNPAAIFSTNDSGAYLTIDGLEPGATWSYLIDLRGDWVAGTGARLELEEGLHKYLVRQTDLAGNESVTGSEFYLDSSGIAPLSLQLAEDSGTPNDGITFNPQVRVGGIKDGATWELRVDQQPLWTRGEGTTFDLLPATHTYKVRQTDRAGNTSTSEQIEFTYAGEAATPLLRLLNDTGPGQDGRLVDGISNEPAVRVYFLEPGATWEYRVDDGPFVSGSGDGFDMIQGGTPFTFAARLANAQDGEPHTYYVRQTNAAGKPSLVSVGAVFTYDASPPEGLTLALATDSGIPGDNITNVPELRAEGLSDGDVFEYRIGDREWILWRANIMPMEIGQHRYQIRRYDVAGNASSVSEGTFTYLNADIEAPTLTLANDTGSTAADGSTTDGTIQFVPSGSDPNAAWEYQIDGGPWLPGSGDSFSALPGSHTYSVRQVDAAGNASPESEPVTVNLSVGAPVFSSAAVAVIADPDSEGLLAIGTDTVLYTALAVDTEGGDVNYSLVANAQLTIDAQSGELRFAQPTGFTLAGPNTYPVIIVARNTAGSEASLSVQLRVLRTNTSAPRIDLGEFKTGLLPLGSHQVTHLLPDGSVLVGNPSLQRLDATGKLDTGFTTLALSDYAPIRVDGQGRIYGIWGNITSIFITRFLANGTLDTSYGSGGTTSFTATPSTDRLATTSLEVSGDGTLSVVGGQTAPSGAATTGDSMLLVIDPNGTILTNQRTDFSPGAGDTNRRVRAGLDPRHLFVSNIYSTSGLSYNAHRVHRYVDRALDSSFASGGALALAFEPRGMWVDRQGRIVLQSPSGGLTRYSASGVLDGGFAAPTMPIHPHGEQMVFGADGASWYYSVSNSTGAEVRRLLPNGSLDASFAGNGTLLLGFKSYAAGQPEAPFSFRPDAAGANLVVLGLYYDQDLGASVSTLTRFSNDGILDNRYGDVALTITEGNRPIALLTTAASIIDADSAATNYGGVSVTIEREGGPDSTDLFSGRGLLQLRDDGHVAWDSVVVGTFSRANGSLTIVFNESATHPKFDSVVRALTYYNKSQQPPAQARLVWTVNDNDPLGARTASATQTINIVDDRLDVGDPFPLNPTLNGGTITLQDYAQIGGRHYYVVSNVDHRTLDDRFNAGEDTTDLARSVTPADGNTYLLLTQGELQALWADPALPDNYTASSLRGRVWTATLGTSANTHMLFVSQSNSFQSLSDSGPGSIGAAIVEVLPSPFATTTPVDPSFALAEDNGPSFNDNLTSNGRLNIIGFEQTLSFEFSLNSGATWTRQPAGGDLSFVLPAGVHTAGQVKARQLDQTGFETQITNTVTYTIDPTIRSLQLFNDQGLAKGDGMSADGRVTIQNFVAAAPFEYSIDNGQTWQIGGPLAGGLGFVLPTGVYQAGDIRVRQDVNGFATGANNNTKYVIDPVTGQGTIRLNADTGSNATDGLTSEPQVNLTGLVGGLAWEYSTNGGSTWQAGAAVAGANQSFNLPDGIHSVGSIRARQTDAAGFEAQITNTTTFNIDRTVRSLNFLNDQGTRTTDNVTADGRIVAVNFNPLFAYEYTVNGGQIWTAGGTLGAELGFTLPNGSYPAGRVRVRQTIAGFTTDAANGVTYTVDPVNGQGVIDLGTDAGTSATDGLTSEARVTVTGLVRGRPWEYSTDNGGTWQAGAATDSAIQSLTLPEGAFAAGTVRARQTDAADFLLTLASTSSYTIDRTIGSATIAMVNDTGLSSTDLTTADGRVRADVSGIVSGDTWAYTIDGGANWTQGVGTSGTNFVLANGSYTARQVRVRVSDDAGNQAVAEFDRAFRIDNTDTVGPVFSSPSTAVVLDPDGAAAQTIPTTRTLYTPVVTDANLVVFSLSGAESAAFRIDLVTGKLTFAAATGFTTAGPNTRTVTLVATDLFGNASSLAVSVKVAAAPQLVSSSPANNGSVASRGTLSFTFDQPIRIGTGTIELFNRRTWGTFEVGVTDASQVSVSGNTLTLRPTTPLPNETPMFASFFSGAVLSLDGFKAQGAVVFFDVTNGVQLASNAVVGLGGEVKIELAPADDGQPGYSSEVFNAGDVNGDGRDDLLLAIPTSDPSGRTDAGRVYVIFGTASKAVIRLAEVAAGTGGFVIDGIAAGDRLGTAAAGIGDFNGDGKSDLAVTAPRANGNIGEAYVVYGKATTTPVSLTSVKSGQGGFAIRGEDAVQNFDKVSAIGDFNGDGRADVAFASTEAVVTVTTVSSSQTVREWTTTRTWQTVDVNTVNTTQPVTVVNPVSVYEAFDDPITFALDNTSSLFSSSPQSAFTEEVALQETTRTTTTTTTWTETTFWRETTAHTTTLTVTSPSAGIVYVLFGGRPAADYQNLTVSKLARPLSTLGFSISGIKASESLGHTMSRIGDVNNDGRDDFFVAGYAWSGVPNQSYVVLGTPASSPGNKTSALLTTGDGGYRLLDSGSIGAGLSAAPLGDWNGDGFADFAVASTAGPVLVVNGRQGSNQIDLAAVRAGTGGYEIRPAGNVKPTGALGLGDINGDNLDDLMVSDEYLKAWVVYGRAGAAPIELRDVANGSGGFQLDSTQGEIWGMGVAGDFDGDGLNDLAFLLNNLLGVKPYVWLVPGSTVGVSQ